MNVPDLVNALRAFQRLAMQRTSKELFDTAIRIAMEDFGAHRGCLLLEKGNTLWMAADGEMVNEQASTRVHAENTPVPAGLPASIFEQVRCSRRAVLMTDANLDTHFSAKTMDRHAHSVLCLPLVDQTDVLGFLYLERKKGASVFTAESMAMLSQLTDCIVHLWAHTRQNEILQREVEKLNSVGKELAFQRYLLKTLAEAFPHRIYAKDVETRFIFGNQAVAEGMGVSSPDELLGKTDFGFYPKEDAMQYREEEMAIMHSGQPMISREELVNYLLTNDTAWMLTTKFPLKDDEGKVIGIVGINYNITERKRMELELLARNAELSELNAKLSRAQTQLEQSEKLASIGQLAAGVAHEINNPIGYVFSNFGTLETYLADLFQMLSAYEQAEGLYADPDIRAKLLALKSSLEIDFLKEDIPTLISESKEGIGRVRNIVQDLKDFSHVDATTDWQFSNLNQGIDSTLNVVNSEIKFKADVVKDYGELPLVQCMSSQINQVVMNLVINAAHAIGAERGKITIRTGVEDDKVWFSVTDTGSGIPKEVLPRIFDPFYTTKPVGKGTGLGLSLSFGIVQKHHGSIEVQTEVGKGTTFRVTIPVSQPVSTTDAPEHA